MRAAKRTGERPRPSRKALPTRRIVLTVPDLRQPRVAEELRRQSLALRRDAAEREAVDFIAKVADSSEWK